MDNLNFGWDFPIIVALGAMILFFAGATLLMGVYVTVLFFLGQFSGKAIIVFWLCFLTALLVAYTCEVSTALAVFALASPAIAAVFWYYEREQCKRANESEFQSEEN